MRQLHVVGGNWLRWQLLRVRGRVAWPVWFALAVLAVATVLGVRIWQFDLEAKRLGAFRSGAVVQAELPRPRKPVTENDLNDYYAMLPHEEERFMLVKRVLLAAEKHGVLPQLVDYKIESEGMTRVVRYQMTLPLKGDFALIQSFLIDVLNENRSLAIDSINLRRESVERGDVEARVQFSVLMVQL